MILIVIAMLIALAAVFNAIMDTVKDHYTTSVFRNMDWFSPESWRNKYKNGDPEQGRKFWGSTTFLVWITNGWHLCKLLFLLCLFTAVSLGVSYCHYSDVNTASKLFMTFFLAVIFGFVFEFCYSFLFQKK